MSPITASLGAYARSPSQRPREFDKTFAFCSIFDIQFGLQDRKRNSTTIIETNFSTGRDSSTTTSILHAPP
ncbi:hypothetical protein CMEL01_04418 [Colletotrichum melonis]|uniref:Uncharacterized protein n=1 Tax=Colletotrichum melonis TaxID=1209925 RepID=A0AAI9UES8_9PEZI|nr:hypothetical protein CMEL01_04418 [Colletotrichum melonis]